MDILSGTETDRSVVMEEILLHLKPFNPREVPITGGTIISKDLTIDSLAVMNMVTDLEDRFDVSVPMGEVLEIHTVDELVDKILEKRRDGDAPDRYN